MPQTQHNLKTLQGGSPAMCKSDTRKQPSRISSPLQGCTVILLRNTNEYLIGPYSDGPSSDFAQRVRARNSFNFHPIWKINVPSYSGDRYLSVEHPQSRFGPILRDGYFWRRYLGVAQRRRVWVWDLKNPSKVWPTGWA